MFNHGQEHLRFSMIWRAKFPKPPQCYVNFASTLILTFAGRRQTFSDSICNKPVTFHRGNFLSRPR